MSLVRELPRLLEQRVNTRESCSTSWGCSHELGLLREVEHRVNDGIYTHSHLTQNPATRCFPQQKGPCIWTWSFHLSLRSPIGKVYFATLLSPLRSNSNSTTSGPLTDHWNLPPCLNCGFSILKSHFRALHFIPSTSKWPYFNASRNWVEWKLNWSLILTAGSGVANTAWWIKFPQSADKLVATVWSWFPFQSMCGLEVMMEHCKPLFVAPCRFWSLCIFTSKNFTSAALYISLPLVLWTLCCSTYWIQCI